MAKRAQKAKKKKKKIFSIEDGVDELNAELMLSPRITGNHKFRIKSILFIRTLFLSS